MAVIALVASAVPAKRGIWKTVLLNSGEQIRVQLCGDEFLHYWKDAQGVAYEEDEQTGRYAPVSLAEQAAKASAKRTPCSTSSA